MTRLSAPPVRARIRGKGKSCQQIKFEGQQLQQLPHAFSFPIDHGFAALERDREIVM